MAKTCFVLGCKSGYKTDQTKISLFKARSNKIQLKKWLDVSRTRKPPKIKGDIFFCANHFHETDIIKFSTKKYIEPNQAVPLKVWRLKSGALPKIPKREKTSR
jgi:hypothetical protein